MKCLPAVRKFRFFNKILAFPGLLMLYYDKIGLNETLNVIFNSFLTLQITVFYEKINRKIGKEKKF
jgi:hypothetical protein